VFGADSTGSDPEIQERLFFYVWSEEESVVRWMCSFDTTEDDVRTFAEFVAGVLRGCRVRAERSDFPLWFCLRGKWRKIGVPIFVFWLPELAQRAFWAAAMRLRPARKLSISCEP